MSFQKQRKVGSFSFQNTVRTFILKGYTVKIYLRVFEKKFSLGYVVCSRVDVLGTKKISDKEPAKNRSANLVQLYIIFMIFSCSYTLATLYLKLSTAALNSDMLSDLNKRYCYLNAELVKNLLTVNLIQVIHSSSTVIREHNENDLILSTVYRVCFVIVCSSIGAKLTSNKRIGLLRVNLTQIRSFFPWNK